VDPDNTESDLKCRLTWQLFSTTAIPKTERHPPSENRKAMDINLETTTHMIVIELCLVPSCNLRKQYQNVQADMDDVILEFQTLKQGKVRQLHEEKKTQVAGYANRYPREEEEEEEKRKKELVAFVVTEVGSLYVVEEVTRFSLNMVLLFSKCKLFFKVVGFCCVLCLLILGFPWKKTPQEKDSHLRMVPKGKDQVGQGFG